MKTIIISITLLGLIFTSCNQKDSHKGHKHDTENHEGHDHSTDLNHKDKECHEGHDHDHNDNHQH